MSLETIIGRSKQIEGLLKELGYRGKGLHELVSHAEPLLDRDVVRACRTVATIRNKAVHEEGYRLSGATLQRYTEAADLAAERLSALLAASRTRVRKEPARRSRVITPGPARSNGTRQVFGKGIRHVEPERAAMPLMPYLLAAGMTVGAVGIWLWRGST